MNRKIRTREQGFTLIEIIAVLVILGILAAVAVPKFFDMQESAEKKTLEIALNDMKSRAVSCYSTSMLEGNGVANATEDCGTFNDLGFNSTSDITDAYKDFAGEWTFGSTSITYKLKNGGAEATFALNATKSDEVPGIRLSFDDEDK
jgi:prepilin-type N-terminal cleavage/methylation domain-containing protein